MENFISLEEFEKLNGEIPTYLREHINGEKTMKGREKLLDPDSSKKAWEHYNEVYKNKFKKINNELNLSGNRYISTVRFGDGEIKLGGDCDFNFSNRKTEHSNRNFTCYKDLIKYSKAKEEQKIRVSKKLNLCINNHHTLINFSLMPVKGGLNNIKQSLDKYDGLIKVLRKIEKYYEKGEEVSSRKNIGLLHEHLDGIGSFKNYLKLYYFEDLKDFLDYVPISKKYSRKDLNNFEKYLDNVMTYWVEKSKNLTKF